jgi:hypothetical protein
MSAMHGHNPTQRECAQDINKSENTKKAKVKENLEE